MNRPSNNSSSTSTALSVWSDKHFLCSPLISALEVNRAHHVACDVLNLPLWPLSSFSLAVRAPLILFLPCFSLRAGLIHMSSSPPVYHLASSALSSKFEDGTLRPDRHLPSLRCLISRPPHPPLLSVPGVPQALDTSRGLQQREGPIAPLLPRGKAHQVHRESGKSQGLPTTPSAVRRGGAAHQSVTAAAAAATDAEIERAVTAPAPATHASPHRDRAHRFPLPFLYIFSPPPPPEPS